MKPQIARAKDLGINDYLTQSAKLIAGRNENENRMLTMLAKEGDYIFEKTTINGPTADRKGSFSPDLDSEAMMIRGGILDDEEPAKLRTLKSMA
jgi:hypothetical protein